MKLHLFFMKLYARSKRDFCEWVKSDTFSGDKRHQDCSLKQKKHI